MSQQPFAATHLVPPAGMAAYERADPNASVVAQLQPHLDVLVAERLGDWARIVCSNGWGAWVDGRQLVPRSGALAAPAAAAAARVGQAAGQAKPAFKLDAAIGGVALIALGSFLPWLRGSGLKGNAFDIPAAVLWSSPTSASDGPVDLWVLLGACAIAGAVFSFRPDGEKGRRIAGIVAAVIALLYVVFLFRLGNAFDVSLTKIINIGPFVVGGGGALLAFGKVTR